jgi:hypothetical protein
MASAAALVVAASQAGGHVLLARGDLSPAARALRDGRDYAVGAWGAEPGTDLDEFRWTQRRAHFVLRPTAPWLAAKVWVAHPDVSQDPVHLTVATPCQVLLDGERRTTEPLGLGLQLPDGLTAVDLTVTVSRTWRPGDLGAADQRRLGAGVALKFRPDRAAMPAAAEIVEIRACR